MAITNITNPLQNLDIITPDIDQVGLFGTLQDVDPVVGFRSGGQIQSTTLSRLGIESIFGIGVGGVDFSPADVTEISRLQAQRGISSADLISAGRELFESQTGFLLSDLTTFNPEVLSESTSRLTQGRLSLSGLAGLKGTTPTGGGDINVGFQPGEFDTARQLLTDAVSGGETTADKIKTIQGKIKTIVEMQKAGLTPTPGLLDSLNQELLAVLGGGGGGSTVTVKSGDTLSAIAEREGISLEELKRLNPELERGRQFDLIFPGDVVKLSPEQTGAFAFQQSQPGGVPAPTQLGIDGSQLQNIQAAPGTAQLPPEATDFISSINALLNSLTTQREEADVARDALTTALGERRTGASILAEQFEAFGILESQTIVAELNRDILEQQRILRDLPDSIRATLQDVGVSKAQLDRLILKERKEPAELLRDLLERKGVETANINQKMSFINSFTNVAIRDEAVRIAALQTMFELEEGDVTKLEDKQMELLKLALDFQSNKLSVADEAISNGASQEVVDEILAADSSEEARSILAASGFGVKPGTTTKSTQEERRISSISNFSAAFVPGATLSDGTLILGTDGFMDPRAWKEAIADAPNEGLTRQDFIEEFGFLVNTDKDAVQEYGLTATELKLITGEL